MPAPNPKKPNPDPFLNRLREIYNEAAARAPIEARPKFEKVSNTFETWVAAAETGDAELTARKKADFSIAWDQLNTYCKTNSAAFNVLRDMSEQILAATEEFKDPPPPPPKRGRGRHYDL